MWQIGAVADSVHPDLRDALHSEPTPPRVGAPDIGVPLEPPR